MTTHSTEFIDDDVEYEPQRSLHRSRSGGYVDHLEEQVRWDRRDRDREMKRYHDSRYGNSASTLSPLQPRSTHDRLRVPIIENSVRRNRSSSEVGERQERPSSRYNVQEVKPTFNYDLTSEPALPSQLQLPVRTDRKSQHHKKPSITVQVHQDTPPSKSPAATPKRSPNASPRSPTTQPQLHYQYATLQNHLAQISETCTPYLKVEPANPRDLTFTKIADQVKSFSFDLRVWAHTVSLNSMTKIDPRKRRVVESASRNLDRLVDSVRELNEACSQAKPRDLKVERLPEVDGEVEYGDDDDGGNLEGEADPTSSPGFVIHCLLYSIEVSIGNLKRLSRSLQEASYDAREEVIGVSELVEEVAKYFGSEEALARYRIDQRFAGGKALDEARYAAAR